MNFWKFITVTLIAVLLLWYLYPSRDTESRKDVTELTIWAPGYFLPELTLVGEYFEKENPE